MNQNLWHVKTKYPLKWYSIVDFRFKAYSNYLHKWDVVYANKQKQLHFLEQYFPTHIYIYQRFKLEVYMSNILEICSKLYYNGKVDNVTTTRIEQNVCGILLLQKNCTQQFRKISFFQNNRTKTRKNIALTQRKMVVLWIIK